MYLIFAVAVIFNVIAVAEGAVTVTNYAVTIA